MSDLRTIVSWVELSGVATEAVAPPQLRTIVSWVELSGTPIAVPPAVAGGGVQPRFPFLAPAAVEGVGYGILPELEGEAHGLVVGVGSGAGILPRSTGAGTATIAVAGGSAARLEIKAAANGELGLAGSGAGNIIGIKAAAIGRHDDDEAVMIALLLAA